ncbi:MAG: aminoacyl-tRNA hydrolase [Bacteroidetes bacterium]|nr:aminoacyl-tRNA hydrolase [Bacteroidota bacterium]MBV6461409.1 Peptidyl-tRNA hydrolase [Flavobacteriales bacterium]WKZ75190.1 MAG: aminoacyl-tRNA hydrolase [Vicingaceae bacterium]MCL4817472.1 aminoacyl-tRNA hydrolase [Flavobacteriales bacterium]NOG94426.1 aminoacyl-tRNA hydrolase [Bacteroidota bacterium]
MKYLVAALGNIGEEYKDTRHNIGFKIADALADASASVFTQDRLAFVCETKWKGRTLILIKPTTFMNLSGKAVQYWVQKEKISSQNLLVVTDDIALPFGAIRIKTKGSDGGHNGLKNIIECLQTQEFPRLRFGIGNHFPKGKQSDYVLGKWSKEEEIALSERIKIACDAIQSFAAIGLDYTMNFYNKK